MEDDVTRLTRHCPQCMKTLPADAPEGLCASCLLTAGVETLTGTSVDEALTVSSGPGHTTAAIVDTPRLAAGQTWGHYRIGRLLGRGGMGEVYEAEQTGTGRRLALKVLRGRLQDADDRARFLREGQLAASISHPHTVYIFGSEEIAGVPVISMELLPGGTLKDRVAAHGPLPYREAVSAVLDIVGGLDAAQSAGILHRDIKPSNCFIDSEGSVKVGDFGLSISTLARDVRHELATIGFQGTPQFAPPEQLRGEPLDIRADIYAVGATLYYLLTGRPPFDAPDLRALFARVTSEPPVSPRVVQREIPGRLASIVVRCLAKTPAERPASYAALADQLRPFANVEDAPAPLGVRLMAGVVDSIIAGLPYTIWKAANTDITLDTDALAAGNRVTWMWLQPLIYYFLLEGIWGTSPGKKLFGLRVSTAEGAAWWPAIARRTAVFYLPSLMFTLAVIAFGPLPLIASGPLSENITLNPGDMREVTDSLARVALAAALFLTVRRSNGWAGLHELASGTRVVSTATARRRERDSSETALVLDIDSAHAPERYGPFIVSGQNRSDTVLDGFDPVLRRPVWIHQVPPGTPPMATSRCDVSRIGRLHWLTGLRSEAGNWDAFEAPDGRPFVEPDDRRAGWPAAKLWLQDLATELDASIRDNTMPVLGLDRLWLRRDGRMVLLDFPARGTDGPAAGLTPVGLLSAAATRALQPSSTPELPLSVRAMLTRWSSVPEPALEQAREALAGLSAAPDVVLRRRRAVPIALATTPLVFLLALATLVAIPTMFRFFGPQAQEMLRLLEALYQPNPPAGSRWADPVVREAAEVYVAGRHRARLTDSDFWDSPVMRGTSERLRGTASAIAARHPSITAAETARAAQIIAPELQPARNRREMSAFEVASVLVNVITAFVVLVFATCAIVSAALVPGGITLRLLGLAVVTRTGNEIGRVRSLLRACTAWSPAIVWLIYLAASPKIQGFVPVPPAPLVGTAVTLILLSAGAIWTIAQPTRGPHDRLAGTWIVPR